MSNSSTRRRSRDLRIQHQPVARSTRFQFFYPGLIVLAGWLAYAGSFDTALVLDDEPAIVENTQIHRLWPLRAPAGTTVSGRPTIAFTLALNYALAPLDVRDNFEEPRNLRGYHTFNFLVHAATALLFFGVVRRTLLSAPLQHRFGSSAATLAFVVSLIWIIHPLTTSAVTYVIQRAESLMALLFVATLYCSIRAWERRYPWTPLAVAACLLGMGAKETMVMAPIAVLLWDYIFAAPARSRWGLYAALAATWIPLAVLVSGSHRPDAVGFGFAEWPWWRYLITQAGVLLHYLRLVVVPWPLVLDYGWPAANVTPLVLLQVAGISALVILTIWLVWRKHPAGFPLAVMFLVLAPTSSVLPIVTEVAAEHRMYLPLAAMVALLVMTGYAWSRRLAMPSALGIAIVAGIVASFGSLTMARNRDYQTDEDLWRDTVQKRPSNARAHHNYATVLLAQHRYAEAETHFTTAIQIRPDFAEALAALGAAECAQGRFDAGVAHLERAVSIAPSFAGAEQNLGEAYAAQGKMVMAATHYERALRQKPDDLTLLNRLGWILATDSDDMLRDGARALVLAERALSLTSQRDVTSLDTAAAALAELGRFQEATATARDARALARSTGERDIEPELEQRLRLYEAGQRFRQPAVRR